jgi:hypothetical protein
MDSPAGFTLDSDANVPASERTGGAINNDDVRRILEEMYTRQQQMEVELECTRAALNDVEAERRRGRTNATNASTNASTTPLDGRAFSELLATLNQVVAALARPNPERELAVPREWKLPNWDSQAETLRDYLLRIRGSYCVRSASKPPLPDEYYWNAIYDTLPSQERARMRYF